MSYAVIAIDNSTKRILKAKLYSTPQSGEIGVEELPSGNLTDYLYQDGKYEYSPINDESAEELAQRKAQEEADRKRQEALDKLPETVAALKKENEMLKQCLLEMSEIVYA